MIISLAVIAPTRDDFVDDFLRAHPRDVGLAPSLTSRDVLGNPGVHVIARGSEGLLIEGEFRARRTLDRAR